MLVKRLQNFGKETSNTTRFILVNNKFVCKINKLEYDFFASIEFSNSC